MASSKDPTLRYSHVEGNTQVCYNESGEFLISCGDDGEVRFWKGIDDDNPNTVTAGEKTYGIAVKGSIVYVASDNNAVEKYKIADGDLDGILARFTGNATCICVSESKKFVAAGSSDFDIKVINLETKKQKCFLGHQAPVLSVSLDPNDEFLASTSCDGILKIWELQTEKCIKSIDIISSSNDIVNSKSLARLCWRPATGEDIAVATEEGIKIFSRVTWALLYSLTTKLTEKAFQCCSFSPCGRFIASSTADGYLIVWDAETQECLRNWQHPLRSSICSLMWDPRENNSLALSDVRGQVGVMVDVISTEQPTKQASKLEEADNDLDALFEEEDDNMMLDLMAEEDKQQDETTLPTLKKKSHVLESDDDDVTSKMSSDLPPIPSTLEVLARTEDLDDIPPALPTTDLPDNYDSTSAPMQDTRSHGTRMQPPFQPGSTPVHLSHRFMVWNSIGVIRAYNDETENAIDVEFHDTRTHHSIHISNVDKYTMADMSDQAVVLASEATDDGPSKLKCVHFSSWDSNKEWIVDMPGDEDIQAVTIGDCWSAVCTDALQVRLFSLGGVQRQLFSIPGPVVTMAAHTDQLLVVYHVTQGAFRSQCLGCLLLEVGAGTGCKPRNIVSGNNLPISPGSTLSWVGFSAEGTPTTVDNLGKVRMMNRQFCNTWTQVADTGKMTKSRHDHYWVVGLHENPQQIRCILCKGATYPSTLPRPTLTVLSYSLPLCAGDSEKSKLEEEYWKTRFFASSSDYLVSRGYEPDSDNKKKSQLQIQQALMRLFALCCRSDNEYQAMEVCSMMPTSASMQLAIKYASRLKRIMLAQRLQEVAHEKLAEETKPEYKSEEEEEEDFRTEMQAGYSNTETEWSVHSGTTSNAQPRHQESTSASVTSSVRHSDADLPDLKSKSSHSLSSQLAGSRRNPFKVSQQNAHKPSTSSAPTSGGVLDNMKRSTPTLQRRTNATSGEAAKKSKEQTKKPKQATQSKLKVNLTSTPKQKKVTSRLEEEAGTSNEGILKERVANDVNGCSGPTRGVLLYIEENLPEIQQNHPDANAIDSRKIAIQRFRALTKEEKQEWNDRAKADSNTSSVARKRKLDDDNNDETENSPPDDDDVIMMSDEIPQVKSQKLDGSCDVTASQGDTTRSKLLAFAFEAAD